MKSPKVIAKINSGGSWPVSSQPDAFKTRLQEDTVYRADMVKTAGVSLTRLASEVSNRRPCAACFAWCVFAMHCGNRFRPT